MSDFLISKIMFKGKRKIVQVLVPDMPKERLSLVMAVDQYPSQDFNRNDAGWISNDLSNLARAQSQAKHHRHNR